MFAVVVVFAAVVDAAAVADIAAAAAAVADIATAAAVADIATAAAVADIAAVTAAAAARAPANAISGAATSMTGQGRHPLPGGPELPRAGRGAPEAFRVQGRVRYQGTGSSKVRLARRLHVCHVCSIHATSVQGRGV